MTLTNFTCQIRVDGKLSGSFARGWRLWEPSSISQPRSWHTLLGLRRSYVAEAYQGIEQVVESLGLQINEAKTKLMVATRNLRGVNPGRMVITLLLPLVP